MIEAELEHEKAVPPAIGGVRNGATGNNGRNGGDDYGADDNGAIDDGTYDNGANGADDKGFNDNGATGTGPYIEARQKLDVIEAAVEETEQKLETIDTVLGGAFHDLKAK